MKTKLDNPLLSRYDRVILASKSPRRLDILRDHGVEPIVNTVLNHKSLKNGSIILMHNGAKYTALALPKVIEGLQEKGFQIVPISKLIYKDNYHMEPDGSQVKDGE